MDTIISSNIEKAKYHLENDELVAIPTETVYGLAGNALKNDCLIKIYKTKNRPSFDPLIIHTNSLEKIEGLTKHLPSEMIKLFEHFSPGPLTYVLEKNNKISDIATSGLHTAAFRVPDHSLTLELLALLDFPIAAPSANLFGKVSPTTPEHVFNQLHGKIPYILNGGPSFVGIESTIVAFGEEGLHILRLGGISVENIKRVLPNTPVFIGNEGKIQAPGQLRSHYATKTPLLLGNVEEMLYQYPLQKTGIITFNKYFNGIATENQKVLSINGDIHEAAANLFKAMHELDQLDLEIILADFFPVESLGAAINDRLKKASINY